MLQQAFRQSQQVMANVATMMSMDVERHREKVEKIRLLNEELRIKYEGDVINAMIEFDAERMLPAGI